MNHLDKNITIYLRSMGKALRVTGIFTSVDDANKFCAGHKDHGVIAESKDLIFTENLYDHGTNIHGNNK